MKIDGVENRRPGEENRTRKISTVSLKRSSPKASKKASASDMKQNSRWSAAMIGVHEEFHNPAKEIFESEAKQVSQLLQGIHYSRKNTHNQVYYPETIERLSKLQANRPQTTAATSHRRRPSTELHARATLLKELKLRDFQENMKHYIVKERHMNFRKKEFNREVGRKAVVNQIIGGTAPMPNHVLFPQGATHEQILAITGTLKAPDPRIIPPAIPKLKKWKGDNEGWSG